MARDFNENVRLILEDAVRHRFFVVIMFLVISCGGMIAGLNWPKVFTSSTTIYVEEQNILGPLMQGAAVQTEVADRSNIARDLIFGRKILLKVMDETGISDLVTSPIQQERIMEGIKERTKVSGAKGLIRIDYSDSDAKKAFEITKLLADLFIGESLADKARESQSAYDFIDQQAEEYRKKLVASEEALKKFRSENIDASTGAAADIGRRTTDLTSQQEQTIQQLNEARIRRQSLVRQLSGEVQTVSNFSRSEEFRTRIGELQSQLDDLRLSYHETYPDIVRIRSQIEDLRKGIGEEEAKRESGSGAETGRIDERVLSNPIYQELQRQLYDTNTLIQTLEARIGNVRDNLESQLERGKHVQEYEARLAELTRDYEVNKEIYADMTRRRESARVSMNLDREQKGLTMRIDEAAYLPHKPSGLQFVHFVMGAPIFGLIVPFGLLFAVRQLDSRIRSASTITDRLNVQVIGVVPHLATTAEARRESLGLLTLIVMLVAGVGIMTGIIVMRSSGQI